MSDTDSSMDMDIPTDNVENLKDAELSSHSSNGSIADYIEDQHHRMDKAVAELLQQRSTQWRQNPSVAELMCVLGAVVRLDETLDDKYRQGDAAMELLLSDKSLQSKIADAWKTGSYRDLRQLDILRAPVLLARLPRSQFNPLRKALTSPYQGRAVEAFYEYLTKSNRAFATSQQGYYGKFCSIVQSPGTGKTRLMLELRKKGVCVLYMNIRSPEDEQGYPDRDNIPADILTRGSDKADEYRNQCYAFFAAVFKVLRTYLESQQLNWYEEMCEIDSTARLSFFQDLDRECANVKSEIHASSTGRAIMTKYYREMVNSRSFPQAKVNQPRVVIALDEAHVLHNTQDPNRSSRAEVLLRTINEYSELTNHAVWVVFASTMSKVAHFASPQVPFPSARVPVKGQLLFPPFTQLGWDQNAPTLNEIPPEEVGKAEHIVRYGRPLWVSLKEHDESVPQLLRLAEQKLCGSRAFDPRNHHQVFAVLAQRFGLDITFGHHDAVRYTETLVASHLRVCLKITEDRMWSYTTYPSEPILSCAAASLLHGFNIQDNTALEDSLLTLETMVNDGLIDVGQVGELVSRFIWLLAKDFFVRKDRVGKDVESRFNQALLDCQLVPVVEFLEFIFGPRVWAGTSDARKVFQNAYVNFSHWVSMVSKIRRKKKDLEQLPIQQWTRWHWERTSAVQCCYDQPQIDKVIPIYFKPENLDDRPGVSQILISDKAWVRSQKSDLKDIDRGHPSIAPDYHGPPYIAILVDLGVEKSHFEVSVDCSKDRDMSLRIYASGLDATTYPFLEGRVKLTRILKDLYRRQTVPSGSRLLQDLEDEVECGKTSEPRYMQWKKPTG